MALMQPYFFPYIGYYQLVAHVDEFVFFDDVNFANKSFVNRNVLLQGDRPLKFSIPVRKKSQNRKIMDHQYDDLSCNLLNQVYSCYKNAPHFSEVFTLIESVVTGGDDCVAVRNAESIRSVLEYLNLKKRLSFSSVLKIEDEHSGQHRVIRVCKLKRATTYVNPIGGKSLYKVQAFFAAGISLEFLQSGSIIYQQNGGNFVPSLSMIDVLMWNDKSKIRKLLKAYSIV